MKELGTKLSNIRRVCSAGMVKEYKRVSAVAVLLFIMVLSIFIGGWAVKPIAVGREIKINVINIPGQPSSWIYNTNDVAAGVQHAVDDVKDSSKNRVRVTGETYSFHEITSLNDLERVIMTAGPNDVIINSHGEAWPVPSSWQTQNDAGSKGDAGGLDDPLIINYEPPLGIYSGSLKGWDVEDCYQFQMIYFMDSWFASPRLEVTLDMHQYADFDLYLFDSNNRLVASSAKAGVGVPEDILIMPDGGQTYKVKVVPKYMDYSLGYPGDDLLGRDLQAYDRIFLEELLSLCAAVEWHAL